jgi:hypothetical protein
VTVLVLHASCILLLEKLKNRTEANGVKRKQLFLKLKPTHFWTLMGINNFALFKEMLQRIDTKAPAFWIIIKVAKKENVIMKLANSLMKEEI